MIALKANACWSYILEEEKTEFEFIAFYYIVKDSK